MNLSQTQIGLALLIVAGLLFTWGAYAALWHIRTAPTPRLVGRRVVARSLAAGVLVGTAVGFSASGIGVLLGASTLGPAWSLATRPDVVAVVCVTAVLLLVRGDPGGRSRWLLGPAVAGPIAGVSSWLLVIRGFGTAVLTPLSLGSVAVVVTSVLLAQGRRAQRVARARMDGICAAGDGILVVDEQGWVLDVRGAAAEALMEASESSADAASRLPKVVEKGLSNSASRPLRVKAGKVGVFEIWPSEGQSPGSRNALRGVLVRDITRQRHDKRNLIRLAHYDSLTGLANRRLFLKNLNRAIEAASLSGEVAALLYIDLDHFKETNDSLGHSGGDVVLQQMAARFLERLRPEHFDGSTLPPGARLHLARLSGDEFALVVTKIADAEAARELANRVLQLVGEPAQIGDRVVTTSASVGIALFPRDGDGVEALIRSADAALYAAKTHGRNRSSFYEPSIDVGKERSANLAEALRQAIERSELTLHYQPKVDVVSQTTVGFEALSRWQSAELGTVSPKDFIPVAEEHGLINEIGAWCLDETCREIRRWRDAGFVPVPVSVNVSSAQFRDDNLQRTVTDALKKHDVEPELLEIELTESLLLDEGENTAHCLRDLRAIGVQIALDDFGTGYSALAYLNIFPLDILKLDRAFLREIHFDRSAAKIVSAVVSMAHGLGLTVVAEGVDSAEQLPILREMQCDQIQGFLYSPAVAPDDAVRLLARRGARPPVVTFGANSLGNLPAETFSGEAVVTEPALKSDADTPDAGSHGEEIPGLLLVDDGAASLESLTVRLMRLGGIGIDLQYASLPDEARLLIEQEKYTVQALVMPPTINLDAAVAIRASLAQKLRAQPPIVVIGEEPDPSVRSRLRALRDLSVLWSPFDDNELAFVLRAALTSHHLFSRRLDIRVPVNLTARVKTSRLKESLVLSSLSSRGAFLEMSDPLPVGSSISLEFDLSTDSFHLFGRVVYQAQEDPDCLFSKSGIGVSFYGTDRATERELDKAVAERAARYLP
jgi:diguanylate cyclase (GGDEF)-like protein